MTAETKRNAIIALFILIVLLLVASFVIITATTSYETRHVFIDGNDIISYDVVDGNTIIIHTENESYEVDLVEDVVDFTVSSNIYIELSKGYHRNCFWDEFEPTDYNYWLNRIIKVPDGGKQ